MADFLERRGHELGRAGLVGVNAGLAFDISEGGRVTAYMLHADVVAFDSGGFFDAWVASDDQVAVAPRVVITEPTFRVAMPTQELADFCELVSEWATTLLPLVEWAVDNVEPEAFRLELALWAEEHGVGLNGIGFIFEVVSLLVRALGRLDAEEVGS
ncbi:hypothetical protein M3672_09165 [Microbacterium enclense]|uniref:hypothetical protein n=1 Tax=Microbacterium enclense TaxID=993073 RepID=UPI00203FBB62|nr:hypothetical protein [Microbacterium enclense]MCM3614605.1 hypothetical protein [Microbacterium enclense]